MSETIKLWLLIAGLGCAAVLFSITAVYAIFKVAKVWIKLYVTLLMLGIAFVAIYQAQDKGRQARVPTRGVTCISGRMGRNLLATRNTRKTSR
jgi:hypothetical protein